MNINLKPCGICLVVLLLFCKVSEAQEKIKFGEVSPEDLEMTVYPDDTAAVAVVLHEDCQVRYDFIAGDFSLKTAYTVRIKVLKPGGLNLADVSIPFYITSSNQKSERVHNISGFTHNLVSGKPQRTKLSKEFIFEEKSSENWKRMKIALQNVQVGSVFEYKFEKSSPFYSHIDDCVFQRSIPVKYSRYNIVIPEYFTFSRRTSGYETIDLSEKSTNITYHISGQTLSCQGSEMTFVTTNLPALKDDSYVWNKSDYTTKLMFDLRSFQITGAAYENYSTTWENIDKQLMEHEKFGRQLRHSNLMKDELAGVLNDTLKPAEKVEAILTLVKGKIQWNEDNTLYIENVRKAIRDGKGSSAEMNAALICLLRDAGFNAYPVVMSLRSRGRIFAAFPTQKSLNYFLTGVDIDGQPAYVDASHKYGTINVIPVNCMVQEARCIHSGKPSEWVDLHRIGKNGTIKTVTVEFNGDGNLSGTVHELMNGIPCMSYGSRVDRQKNVDDTKTDMETKYNVTVSDLEQGKPKGVTVEEKFSFTNENITLGDDFVYLNSLVFPYMTDNPFKAETRKLPIEFAYPFDHMISVTIQIPEGYEVEEVPATERVTLGDRQISYSYLTQKKDQSLQIIQRITVRQTLYPAMEYEHVRDFWTHIIDKNNAQLVLKKSDE